ncbi:hypothetical protein ACJRO7_011475 [Eucalyptus globulus]|uniref:MATH domain-containing protein n=1 Tax=Eucalyptus globulus TaxID=34317 RepID=A0ABD3LJV9_EUCGL
MANPASDDRQGVEKTVSEAQYVVKIQSYSSLSKNSADKYESGVFQAGGYKWKLVLYPNGNKSKNVEEHVSLYLSIVETSSLPSGWGVHALVRFFLRDQDKDNDLIIQDAMRKEWHFHRTKLECGFDQFIPLKTLNDAQNGYLVDDTCSTGQGENLLMIKDAISQKHMWKVNNFSNLDEEFYESKVFIAGNQKWKIRLYPNGEGSGLGGFVSLYLEPADRDTLPPGTKIFAGFTLRQWFSASIKDWGWATFTSHADFRSPNTGYLVKDTCKVEAEVTVLGIANAL